MSELQICDAHNLFKRAKLLAKIGFSWIFYGKSALLWVEKVIIKNFFVQNYFLIVKKNMNLERFPNPC